MDEVHGVLAENGPRTGRRTENLLLAAVTARCAIHCRRLLHNGWELVLDIVDNTRSNRLFYLLGEHSALVLVILKPHRSDLI